MEVIDFKHNKNPFCNHFILSCYKNIGNSKKRRAEMSKIMRILLILGSLVGICATVRW